MLLSFLYDCFVSSSLYVLAHNIAKHGRILLKFRLLASPHPACHQEIRKNSKFRNGSRDSWVNGAIDNGSSCLLVQNVARTERIGLSHSKVAWFMVQEILDNGPILFLFSTSKLYIFSH